MVGTASSAIGCTPAYALAVKVRTQLEEDALPHFVAAQRWYGV